MPKERKRKKALADKKREAEKQRRLAENTAVYKKEHEEEAQRQKEVRVKVVLFCISRLEHQKEAETRAISTKLVKRPDDSCEWDFDA